MGSRAKSRRFLRAVAERFPMHSALPLRQIEVLWEPSTAVANFRILQSRTAAIKLTRNARCVALLVSHPEGGLNLVVFGPSSYQLSLCPPQPLFSGFVFFFSVPVWLCGDNHIPRKIPKISPSLFNNFPLASPSLPKSPRQTESGDTSCVPILLCLISFASPSVASPSRPVTARPSSVSTNLAPAASISFLSARPPTAIGSSINSSPNATPSSHPTPSPPSSITSKP
jgi:hypothetical protein